MRKGTYNYKQISELAPALTAPWICISPLFKAASNYRQKGFESEISAHVILKESFYIYPQSGPNLVYRPTTSSSTCHVSAIAMLLSALALSHPVWLLGLINTERIQDTRRRGLLNSFWHRPSLFLCQPWPVDQAFYSVAMLHHSARARTDLKDWKNTNSLGPALVLWSGRLTHSTDG